MSLKLRGSGLFLTIPDTPLMSLIHQRNWWFPPLPVLATSWCSYLSVQATFSEAFLTTHLAPSMTSLYVFIHFLLDVFACLFVVGLCPRNSNYLRAQTVKLVHCCIPTVGTHICSRPSVTISWIDEWMVGMGRGMNRWMDKQICNLKYILWKIAIKSTEIMTINVE